MPLKPTRVLCILIVTTAWRLFAGPQSGVVKPAIPDLLVELDPGQVRVNGWLGRRVDLNLENRLKQVNLEPLIAGFENPPGSHPWIGEHLGKWIHAATLAWEYSRDEALKQKLDGAVARLISAQGKEGYLGTYSPENRFSLNKGADWDVWSHKYCLIGLQTYHRHTGDPMALAAARRGADLLVRTFPAEKSIIAAGTHLGMAATSVLEPIADLYQLTGDTRYRDFARYIVSAYDDEGGPGLVRALSARVPVSAIANGKAYEMLSNLKGLLDFACIEGEAKWIDAVKFAWEDITTHRLYLTGATSGHEVFLGDDELPNGTDAHVGETCVTTTWIQLNERLLLLTGEHKYAVELERSVYNHLAAAQHPRGDDWCYYTALEGAKKYDSGITCCHSSGPRAMAMVPSFSYLRQGDTIHVNTVESSQAGFEVDGAKVTLTQRSDFPTTGRRTLSVSTGAPVRMGLRVAVGNWTLPARVGSVKAVDAGWQEIASREWKDGDVVEIDSHLGGRIVEGKGTNYGRSALFWGPFVLALDQADNEDIAWVEASLRVVPEGALTLTGVSPLKLKGLLIAAMDPRPRNLVLVPFAEAGSNGSSYRVWFRSPLPPASKGP